jgi:hypothetical protein
VTSSAPSRLEGFARTTHRRLRDLSAVLDRWKAQVPWLVGLARTLFYPCALALVAYMGYKASQRTDLSSVHYAPLALAYVAALVWWLSLALGWSFLAGEGSHRRAMTQWCQTQVARYMPGGIWAVVARATTVRGRIRDKLTAVTAENVIVLLVSLAVGGFWATVHDIRWLPLVLLLLAPLVTSRWLEKRTRITRSRVRRTASAYGVGYLFYGVLGVLVQIGVSGLHDPTYPLYVAGASCVAWAVGLVVVIAPGGVGVREVVYIWMLSGLYPTGQLEAAAVTSRLVTVAAELTVLLALWLLDRTRDRRRAAR